MSNIKEAMELMGRIIDKYGEEKGAKIVECLHVTLALSCYDYEIGKATLQEIVDLNERIGPGISKKESDPPPVLYGWVWERVLTDYTSGIAVAFAPDESGAWDALKRVDRLAWRNIREHPEDRDDPRTPEELPHRVRPRKIDAAEAFAVWGGG